MPIVVECPVNNLSFGNCSVNILRALYEKGVEVLLFPTSNTIELSAYDKIDKDFRDWVMHSYNLRYSKISRDLPTLKIWHILGSEYRITDRQYLFSFYELDSPTDAEVRLLNMQEKTFFSSSHSVEAFAPKGVNTSFVPLGFDPDFHLTNREYLGEEVVHFGLIGKFEKRKHTAKILRLWADRFGNDPKYRLTALIYNQFHSSDDNNKLIASALGGKRYWNMQFFPYLKTNSEVNEVLNSINIDLSGLSGAEGWGLPAFHATGLGKWSVVLNVTGHKDWANEKNCVLVEPSGQESALDGVFFKEGEFNQGNIHNWREEDFHASIDVAIRKAGEGVNKEGLKLQKSFTWGKTVDRILKEIK